MKDESYCDASSKTVSVKSYNNSCSTATNGVCARTPVNGSCGSSTNTCSAGSFVDQADTITNLKWNCVGANGGIKASCDTKKGICGSAKNTCSYGNVWIDQTPTAAWDSYFIWRCGYGNGTNVSCTAHKPKKSCSIGGVTLQHGQSGTFLSKHNAGNRYDTFAFCSGVTRTCNNGVMSGNSSYSYSSCIVETDTLGTATWNWDGTGSGP